MTKEDAERKKIIHIKGSGFSVQSVEDITEEALKEIEERDRRRKEEKQKPL